VTEGRRESAGREVVAVLFVGYLILLGWLVLFKLNAPYVGASWMRHVKLVPFIRSDGFGASDPLEVVGNVAVFVPFGVCLALLAVSWSWWRLVGVMAAVSGLLEVTQYVLAVGSSDLSDVISNTAGGCIGMAMVALAGRPLAPRPPAKQRERAQELRRSPAAQRETAR
jgi:glycopeptide antibiotics resistance protein